MNIVLEKADNSVIFVDENGTVYYKKDWSVLINLTKIFGNDIPSISQIEELLKGQQ